MISRQNTTMAKILELMDSFNLIIVEMYKVFICAPSSKILEIYLLIYTGEIVIFVLTQCV